MPRLWNDTIETHRHEVRSAILEAAGTVASEEGLLAATMSRIAERAGIGRATLYKYFPDAESVLLAWHEQHVTEHVDQLVELASGDDAAGARLEAMLIRYAEICYFRGRHGTRDVGALVHQAEKVTDAERRLGELFRVVIKAAHAAGDIRDDVDPRELAEFCQHALTAAGSLRTEAATKRLVALVMSALAK